MSLLKMLGRLILVISLLALIFMILVFIKHLSGFWFDFITIFFFNDYNNRQDCIAFYLNK